MDIKSNTPGNGAQGAEKRRLYRGRGVGQGLVVGVSRQLNRESAASVIERCRLHGDSEFSVDIPFDELIAKTVAQVEESQKLVSERLPEATTLLFDSHLMMLQDPVFHERVQGELRGGGTLAHAIAEASVAFIQFYESSPHEYMREKAHDIEDIALHLLRNLSTNVGKSEDCRTDSGVIIARELLPSDIVRIAQRNASAIILTSGGLTSHVSLLVRSLGIPMVIANAPELLQIKDGTTIVVDGMEGTVRVSPSAAELDAIRRSIDGARTVGLGSGPRHAATRDGAPVGMMANINLLSEVGTALDNHADGVGLYRTELLYLMRKDLPPEADQERIYRGMLERMDGRIVVFRTLDAGGDKVLSYFNDPQESNPALGLRSTRFTLRHTEVFDAQLRAIIRAAGDREGVGVLFPMIGSLDEWRQARARFDACAAQVEAETGKRNRIRLGMMVELPAVADLADEFAAEVGFFSIGTNDFIQYTLGADRTNENVAGYYCPHHPSVLRALKRIVSAATRAGTPLSVCGEMAHDPRYIPFFVGIGVRVLSVDPSYLHSTQDAVESISVPEAEAYAEALLAEPTIAGVESLLAPPAASNR